MRTHRKPEQTLPVIFPYTGGVFFFPFSPIQNTPTVRSISALSFFPLYISLHLYGRFSLFPIFHRTYHFICTVDFRSFLFSTVHITPFVRSFFALSYFPTVQISPFVHPFSALSYFRPYQYTARSVISTYNDMRALSCKVERFLTCEPYIITKSGSSPARQTTMYPSS